MSTAGESQGNVAGQSAPALVTWQPGYPDAVKYAAAMWEFQRLHFDVEWARREGLRTPIVQGPLLGTKLSQLVDHWARANGGTLRQIRWRNLSEVEVDSEVTLSGRVVDHSADGTLTLELAILSSSGEEQVRGSALVSMAGSVSA